MIPWPECTVLPCKSAGDTCASVWGDWMAPVVQATMDAGTENKIQHTPPSWRSTKTRY
jgi:hypothetical protein